MSPSILELKCLLTAFGGDRLGRQAASTIAMTHGRVTERVRLPSSVAPAALALGLLCSTVLVTGQTTYTATLSAPPYKPKDGDNSPPPPHSSAQGSAQIVVGNGQVTYSLTLKDVPDFYQVISLLKVFSSPSPGDDLHPCAPGMGQSGCCMHMPGGVRWCQQFGHKHMYNHTVPSSSNTKHT